MRHKPNLKNPRLRLGSILLLCLFVAQLCGVAVFAATPPPGEDKSSNPMLSIEEQDVPFASPTDITSRPPSDLQLQPEDVDILQARGVYTVAYSENYRPFSYTDGNGNALGMAITIMNHIAELANIQVEYISVNESQRHNVSVDINLAILSDDQMDGVSRKSLPYTSLQMMAIGDSRTLSSEDSTFGHLPYTYLAEGTLEKALPGGIMHTYFTYDEMAQDYLNGTLDYMLVSSLVSGESLDLLIDDDTYQVPTAVNLYMYMSYSDNFSDEEVDAFDHIIRSLESTYVYNLMLSTVIASNVVTPTFLELLEAYAVPILFAILIVGLVVVAIIFKAATTKRKLLERTINVDELTGLMTERKFLEASKHALKQANPREYVIITIDIDNFKTINEVYGYALGTETITAFAETLKTIFADSPIIARFFADNFGILYRVPEDATDYITQETYEGAVRTMLSDLLGDNQRLATSAGIYRIEDTSLSLSYMLDCANVARRQGKSNYSFTQHMFTKELSLRMHQKNTIVRTMESAIVQKEFQVYYQPQISLKDGSLIGAEALVRWILPDGERRFPDEFIPIFESNGFISKVDHFVLDSVCQFLRENPHIPKISVNFSGHTMLDESLLDRLQQTLQAHDVNANRLEVEITESAVVANFERIVEQTTKLEQLGFTISMDDFGAGISSLNRLNDMEIDVLKIDKVFLCEQTLSPRSISILTHIIGMTKKLGITTVAEGVEYSEQIAILKNMGCDIAQGYHYAKPMPAQDFLEFIRTYPT